MLWRTICTILSLIIFLSPLPIYQPAQAAVKVPILMYHYIGNNPNPKDLARNTLSVSPDKFDQQMGYLAQQGFTPITLNDLYGIFNNQRSAPAKPIVLTFDDGYIDFYLNAYPILRKYNFHAVSFIPTGLINTSYYMSWAQIKEIQASGLVTFEGHTVSHPNLPLLGSAKALAEMKQGREVLQAQTGFPVNFIAYPFGTSNLNTHNLAKQAGFVGGLGTWNGKAGSPSMNLPRIRITGQMSIIDFAAKL